MSTRLHTHPRADGFRMPGEFEPHAACWMLFPERPDVWREGARPAQRVFAEVARAIVQFEPLFVGASSASYARACALMPPAVRVVELPANDAWMRDCGPTFLVNDRGDVRGVSWEFNAWGGHEGGLYTPWDLDNQVAQRVLAMCGVDWYETSLVNEGGAIHVDGQGTLITTRSVLLNPNRNPTLSQTAVEQLLSDLLAVDQVIWLDVAGEDETDGHVDGLVSFVRPGVLLLSWTDDRDAEAYETCRAVYDQLRAATDAQKRPFEIVKLPLATLPSTTVGEANGVIDLPGSFPRQVGEPVFGGYINFYIANGGVVVPQFGVPEDQQALAILQEQFPDRRVVGVPGCREISLGGGNIHCITQQEPRG